MSDEGFGASTFKEKPDISQVFLRQLDRTNLAASMDYQTSVIQKLNNLPMTWRAWVEAQSDRYTESKPTFIYKAPCGLKLGSKTNPILHDPRTPIRRLQGAIDWSDPNIIDTEDTGTEEEPNIIPVLEDESIPVKRLLGPIDWDDPNISSPRLEHKEYVDYTKMDAIVMEAAEHAGLTWQVDPLEVDAGDTIEYIEERKRTPFVPHQIEDEDDTE